MLIHFEAVYTANTRAEVETKGLELWRQFTQNPTVPLHWSTAFTVRSPESGAGEYRVTMTVKDQETK
jgi:hypothetical protein